MLDKVARHRSNASGIARLREFELDFSNHQSIGQQTTTVKKPGPFLWALDER